MLKLLFLITGFVVWVILLIFVLTVGILIWNYKRKIAVREKTFNKLTSKEIKLIAQGIEDNLIEGMTSQEFRDAIKTLSNPGISNKILKELYMINHTENRQRAIDQLLESAGIDRPE